MSELELKAIVESQGKIIEKLQAIVEAQGERITSLEISRGRSDEKIDNLIATVNSLKNDVGKSLEELSSKVDALNKKPGERWESLIQVLLTAVGGGIIGYILSKFMGK